MNMYIIDLYNIHIMNMYTIDLCNIHIYDYVYYSLYVCMHAEICVCGLLLRICTQQPGFFNIKIELYFDYLIFGCYC